LTLAFNAIIAGIAIGSVYGLIAISYTVIFNATQIFNVAQGDLVATGILISYFMLDVAHASQVLTAVAVIGGVTVLCLLEERLIIRRFLRRNDSSLGWFIATLALSLVLESVNSLIFGQRQIIEIPSPFGSGAYRFGGVSITPMSIAAIVSILLVTVLLDLLYQRTRLGVRMRASAEDRDVAALRGVDPRRVSQLAFGVAGLVAGLAAFVVAPIVSSNVSLGLTFALKGFIALAIGGFGSLRGALIGAWALGISEQLFDLYVNPNYEVVAGLALLLIVFAVRPTGLFGERLLRQV
jgi:branched-chain amino acid transport system permease protein